MVADGFGGNEQRLGDVPVGQGLRGQAKPAARWGPGRARRWFWGAGVARRRSAPRRECVPPGRWRRTGGRCPVPGAAAGERRYTLRRGAVLTAELFADGRPLQFLHPLVRSAVYEQLAPGARAQAHARAAQLLASDGAQPEQVAIQILACEPAGDAAAVRASRAAAAAALVRGAPDTAVTYLRRAWTEPSVTQIREGLLDSRELLAAFQQYARYRPRCSCGGCDGGGLLTAEGIRA
jgi:hypothetical protein